MLSMNMEEQEGISSSSSQLGVDLLTWAMSGTDDRHFFERIRHKSYRLYQKEENKHYIEQQRPPKGPRYDK